MEQTNPTGKPQATEGNGQELDGPPGTAWPILSESIPALAEPGTNQAEIQVAKTVAIMSTGANSSHIEIFTLTLDGETTQLIPGTKWNQLDQHKWTARGKLPAEPIGLEVTLDHVRLAGHSVSVNDPEGCGRLQQVLNDWLLSERETARKKANPNPVWAAPEPEETEPESVRFHVEVDKRGQVHVRCDQGKNTMATIGLTVPGFTSLVQQGLMRKPRDLKVGALHDWVELDGTLFSFKDGRDDSARLQETLNHDYVPPAAVGTGKEVVVMVNSAARSGFDIQFVATVAGLTATQRQHLGEPALELLQDQQHCGLLHKEIILKLIPPNLVIKRRTAEGGEDYLSHNPENVVSFVDDNGQRKSIDLSQPLNLLHITAPELTAVFNHPVIHRHAEPVAEAAEHVPARPEKVRAERKTPPSEPEKPPTKIEQLRPEQEKASKVAECVNPAAQVSPNTGEEKSKATEALRPLPNLWLKDILDHAVVRHDWLAPLGYRKLAKWIGNSLEGKFGAGACWYIVLGSQEDIASPTFKGVVLTERGGLGFLSQGLMLRFNNGAAFIGQPQTALEGVGVELVALALDGQRRVTFIVSENYRAKFESPEATVTVELKRFEKAGAVVMSIAEVLASREPLEVVWTVPKEQADPDNPQALETTKPES